MKKIIALLLAVVMVFALVACASTAKTEEKTDAPAPAETNNEQTTEPAEETDAPAELELDGTDKVFILHDLTTPQLTKQVRDGILARLEEKEAQA